MTAVHQPDREILIVGAGVSGIGMAWHLQNDLPGGADYEILEMRDSVGGTWDLFRYPGIRSDSDLHTFGYAFKPWRSEQSIADGPEILAYLNETADENGIRERIRFNTKVVAADFSNEDAIWTVTTVDTVTGEESQTTSRWLYSAAGYYRYDRAWAPEFKGESDFAGPVVLPQFWPEDLDYEGRRVVVIGSGATAVTVVPAMANSGAAHVTMLQRSPTYIMSVPKHDPIANFLKRWLPAEPAYWLTRRKNILLQKFTFWFAQNHPEPAARFIAWTNRKQLPEGFDMTHFTPDYGPWDQRLCSVPDGDFFKSIRRGDVSVVTDRIDRFVPEGIVLESGDLLEADIIVKATGLDVVLFGGITTTIDGQPLRYSDHLAYRGLMISEIPNFAYFIGYTNSSWTLKVDVAAEYMCRVLDHMRTYGFDRCVAINDDPDMPTKPLLDFGAGYVQRVINELPREGLEEPWYLKMDVLHDRRNLRRVPIEDGQLHFSRAGQRERAAV